MTSSPDPERRSAVPPAGSGPGPAGASPAGRRILLVEDDDEISFEILDAAGRAGHAIERVSDGAIGLEAGLGDRFDLLIVDIMLPGIDGLSLIEALRGRANQTPVLVLSALSAVDDRVSGLKAGGDDYLTKPFAMVELLARVAALLRRPVENRETVLRAGPLVLDLIERTATRGGRPLDLLPREFKLLEYMIRRPGQVLTRAMLLEDVWHYRFVPQTNLVDVHIGKLRRKLDLPGEAALVASVRGAGFCLRVPD